MTIREQLEEKAHDAGFGDAVSGAAKYTTLAEKSPYNYAYEKGYAAGLAKKEQNDEELVQR